MTLGSFGGAAPIGFPIMAHGFDHFFTGMGTLISGKLRDTATSQLLQKTGMSSQTAGFIDSGLSILVLLEELLPYKVLRLVLSFHRFLYLLK